MKVSIDNIKKSPDNRLEIEFEDSIEELNHRDKVKAVLVATASNYGVIVKGNIKAELLLECDRCLNEFVYSLDAEINEEFVAESIVPEDQKDYELGENEFVEELRGEKEIDIKDLIYQSIILQLPYKNLCSQECPGVAEFEKLNYKDEEYIDERLEVFKTFLENKLSNKKEGL